jgi:hypothetical protein
MFHLQNQKELHPLDMEIKFNCKINLNHHLQVVMNLQLILNCQKILLPLEKVESKYNLAPFYKAVKQKKTFLLQIDIQLYYHIVLYLVKYLENYQLK